MGRCGRIPSALSRTLARRQAGGRHARTRGRERPLDRGGHAIEPLHVWAGCQRLDDLVAWRARVVFGWNRKGVNDLYQKPADGSGREELLLESADTKIPESWSPDGRFILYSSGQNQGGPDGVAAGS